MKDHSKRFKLKSMILALGTVIGSALLILNDYAPSTIAGSGSSTSSPFAVFESGHVRPIALSPGKTRLFAINTPDHALEIFRVDSQQLELQARVPVGLEPVSVAARNDNEVWVVNHLSDSVSVVSLTGAPRVVRTLLVGDEPRDVVFAGSPARAFITTAHRGQ